MIDIYFCFKCGSSFSGMVSSCKCGTDFNSSYVEMESDSFGRTWFYPSNYFVITKDKDYVGYLNREQRFIFTRTE